MVRQEVVHCYVGGATALDALSQTAIVGNVLSPVDVEWQVAE